MLLNTLLLANVASCLTIPFIHNAQEVLNGVSPSSHKHDIESLPLIDSEAIQALVNEQDLRDEADTLFNISLNSIPEYGNPTRVIGSEGHWGTIGHILDVLHKYSWYYDIKVQPFTTVLSKINEAKVAINGKPVNQSLGLRLSPPTEHNDYVKGKLVAVANNGCDDADYQAFASLSNNEESHIALIQRGVCPFSVKSRFALKYGAKAAIIYDNEDSNSVFSGTLEEPIEQLAPTIGITKKTGEYYIENYLNKNLTVDAAVLIDAYVKNVVTKNIIAETKFGDKENIVMAGGHSDSVEEGPGINDDGSGTISLLKIAEYLTNFKPNNAIRIAFWAAEEEGLLGSTYYVKQLSAEENSKLRLFLDYDMMASPNYAFQVYDGDNAKNPTGSEEIKNLYIDWYTSNQLNYTLIPFDGRSDYAAFIENGIPGGGIATGAEGIKTSNEVELFGGKAGAWYDPCYHQRCDDLTNPDYYAWVVNTKLIAHSIATYGESLKGFPERNETKAEVNGMAKGFKYRAHSLVF